VKFLLTRVLKNPSVFTALKYGLIAALIWGGMTVGGRMFGNDPSDFCLNYAICR
jgi:hypothetical protein